MLWVVVFFGFLHSGEFTCSPSAALSGSALMSTDVAVDSHSHPTVVSVHLQHSKTDIFGAGTWVQMGHVDGHICPIKALMGYLAVRGMSPGPLFLFADEQLTVSNGVLFCSACREPVSLKKSAIKLHIDSHKHKLHKAKVSEKEASQKCIAESLRRYDEKNHPSGETLSESVRVYRTRVVKSFLKAGIPLSKVDQIYKMYLKKMLLVSLVVNN